MKWSNEDSDGLDIISRPRNNEGVEQFHTMHSMQQDSKKEETKADQDYAGYQWIDKVNEDMTSLGLTDKGSTGQMTDGGHLFVTIAAN